MVTTAGVSTRSFLLDELCPRVILRFFRPAPCKGLLRPRFIIGTLVLFLLSAGTAAFAFVVVTLEGAAFVLDFRCCFFFPAAGGSSDEIVESTRGPRRSETCSLPSLRVLIGDLSGVASSSPPWLGSGLDLRGLEPEGLSLFRLDWFLKDSSKYQISISCKSSEFTVPSP